MTYEERRGILKDRRLLVLGLLATSVAVGLWLPQPSWWQASASSWWHVNTHEAEWSTHPNPVMLVSMLLFASAGLGAYASIPAGRRDRGLRGPWLVGVTGCLVATPIDLLLFDQSIYESAFGPQPPTDASVSVFVLLYGLSEWTVFAVAVVSVGMGVAAVGLRGLGAVGNWLDDRMP